LPKYFGALGRTFFSVFMSTTLIVFGIAQTLSTEQTAFKNSHHVIAPASNYVVIVSNPVGRHHADASDLHVRFWEAPPETPGNSLYHRICRQSLERFAPPLSSKLIYTLTTSSQL
jgi:hypothetical protein